MSKKRRREFDYQEGERMRLKYQRHFGEAEDRWLAHSFTDPAIAGKSAPNTTAAAVERFNKENSPAEETSQLDE